MKIKMAERIKQLEGEVKFLANSNQTLILQNECKQKMIALYEKLTLNASGNIAIERITDALAHVISDLKEKGRVR